MKTWRYCVDTHTCSMQFNVNKMFSCKLASGEKSPHKATIYLDTSYALAVFDSNYIELKILTTKQKKNISYIHRAHGKRQYNCVQKCTVTPSQSVGNDFQCVCVCVFRYNTVFVVCFPPSSGTMVHSARMHACVLNEMKSGKTHCAVLSSISFSLSLFAVLTFPLHHLSFGGFASREKVKGIGRDSAAKPPVENNAQH